MGVEHVDQLGEVGERACQPVDLVDHDQVDAPGTDVVEQALQGRTQHRAAGDAAIVVEGRQGAPALVPLAEDVGLTRLALCMQGVELLLQPFLGRLSRVDGASHLLGVGGGRGTCPATHGQPLRISVLRALS